MLSPSLAPSNGNLSRAGTDTSHVKRQVYSVNREHSRRGHGHSLLNFSTTVHHNPRRRKLNETSAFLHRYSRMQVLSSCFASGAINNGLDHQPVKTVKQAISP